MDLRERFPLIVAPEAVGQRLDAFLHSLDTQISRSRWARLVDEGLIHVDGLRAKASLRLKQGQVLRIEAETRLEGSDQTELSLTLEPFVGEAPSILFEDDDVLVLSKAAGLTVHPGAGVPAQETLVGWLLQERKVAQNTESLLAWGTDLLEDQRPGIVHRLDRGTSGTLVVAKHPSAHAHLAAQFADRSAGRFYWALAGGSATSLRQNLPLRLRRFLTEAPARVAFRVTAEGIYSLATYLDRDPRERQRFSVCKEGGRRALTHFRVLEEREGLSLLELKLETGRTHQIRVHLDFLQMPIAGDSLYRGRTASRLMLHAHTLYFNHPRTQQRLSFHSPWPEAALEELRQWGFGLFAKEDTWQIWNSILAKPGLKD